MALKILGLRCFMLNTLKSSQPTVNYAVSAAALKKAVKGQIVKKKQLPVEEDPQRLNEYLCGSNIMQEGEDVKLGEDSEYPDWLWKISLEKPPPLSKLDPNTWEYWKRARKVAMRRRNAIMKVYALKSA